MRKFIISWLIFVNFISAALYAYSQSSMITSVNFDTTRTYHSGDTLEVTLNGEAGGNAWFDVDHYVTGISMTERYAGIYTGTFQLPTRVSLSNVQVIGHLQKGDRQDSMIAASGLSTVGVSAYPSTNQTIVTNIMPNNGSYVAIKPTTIVLKFNNAVDATAQQNMRVTLDNMDITSSSTITSNSVSYSASAPLTLGNHMMHAVSTDASGRNLDYAMSFNVESYTPAAMTIFDYLASEPNIGETVTVTALGPPNGRATFDVGAMESGIPMDEISPGTYIGIYHVKSGDSFSNSNLVGHLMLRNGDTFLASSPAINNLISFDTSTSLNQSSNYVSTVNNIGYRTGVTFLNLKNGDTISGPFVLHGLTAPYMDVLVNVQASGGRRNTFATHSDSSGNFFLPIPASQLSLGTAYTITATTRDTQGNLGASTSALIQAK